MPIFPELPQDSPDDLVTQATAHLNNNPDWRRTPAAIGDLYRRTSSFDSQTECELEVVRCKDTLRVYKQYIYSVDGELPDLLCELTCSSLTSDVVSTTVFTVDFGILGNHIKTASIIKIFHGFDRAGHKLGEFWLKAETHAPHHHKAVGLIEPWKIQCMLPQKCELLPAHQLGYLVELDSTDHIVARTVSIRTDVDGIPEVENILQTRPLRSKYFTKQQQNQITQILELSFDEEADPLNMDDMNPEHIGKQIIRRAFELAGRESEWIENVLAAY
jgi:hypothetical protein